jgi:hypothetical protein
MRLIPALAVLCLIPLFAHAEGEIYRWKDSNGLWHYSDQPQPGAELVKAVRKPASASSASTRATTSSSAAPTSGADGIPPVSAEVAQQVRAEAANAKSEQCKKATEAYDKAVQALRIYRVDENGNQIFLNAAELDQARLDARGAKEISCGP